MKKLGLTLASLLLVFCFLFTGCSQYGKIKKAYEDAGYTESTKLEQYQSHIDNALAEEDKESIAAIHLFTKDYVNVAIIVEFKTTEDLVEAIENSETLKGFIKDAQNSDYVNGNCVLIFWLLDGDTPFKSAK